MHKFLTREEIEHIGLWGSDKTMPDGYHRLIADIEELRAVLKDCSGLAFDVDGPLSFKKYKGEHELLEFRKRIANAIKETK